MSVLNIKLNVLCIPLIASLLILLPLKLTSSLPLQKNIITNNQNNNDFEYYLDQFLRLYYNTYIAQSQNDAVPPPLIIKKQRSFSVNNENDDDMWEMQGDEPVAAGSADSGARSGTTVLDVEQGDGLNAIAIEKVQQQARNKVVGGADGDPSVEYLMKMRKRAKDNWIQLLKQNILNQVGWNNYSTIPNTDRSETYPQSLQQPNRSSILDLLRNNNQQNGSKVNGVKFDGLVTEKIRSYYPQCDLPKGTDGDLWNDENILNLYYNVDVSDGNIQTANLRLYRLLNDTDLTDVNCQEDSPGEDEKILRVSAYWYLKPLKKLKAVKKRMCDSKVISEKANWIELNVKPAMANWLRGRNAGLAIVVEDQDGGVLKADHYFIGPSCQAGGVVTPKPIPTFILDALRQPYDPKASPASRSAQQNTAHGLLGQDARAALASHVTLRLPSLDIKTTESTTTSSQPDADEDCESMEKLRDQESGAVQLRHTRHHHRHQHHQRLEEPDDPRGRMIATQIIWTNQQLVDLQKAQQQQQMQTQQESGNSDFVVR